MAECYPFKSDHSLIAHENIVWNEGEPTDKAAITYSVAGEAILTDNINECFVSSDGTEYFSVLESTNDIAFCDLPNLALENPKDDSEEQLQFENVERETEEEATDADNQEVVIFAVNGTNQFYGVQVLQDAEGNPKNCQFQFRMNAKGQLEAIPESLEVIPNDDEMIDVEREPESAGNVIAVENQQIYIRENNSDEQILPDNPVSEEILEQNEIHREGSEENESNLNISEENFEYPESEINTASIVKQESMEDFSHDSNIKDAEICDEMVNCKIENNQEIEEFEESIELASKIKEYYNTETLDDADKEDSTNYMEEYEQIFIEEAQTDDDDDENSKNSEEAEHDPAVNSADEDTLESDSEFQVIDGLHVTGDSETLAIPEPQCLIEESSNANVLKQFVSKINSDESIKDNKNIMYYVVQNVEKENVQTPIMHNKGSGVLYKTVRTNPRSLLKAYLTYPSPGEDNVHDERLEKRFARSKEAIQARMFHNFITKTTIPQAPIRNERLPRKQKIKPVNERVDEEIIVQEVMVSSNGVIEAVEKSAVNNRASIVTDYVELTDTDDEKDESDADSIIEIASDDEFEKLPIKKGRGRPRKSIENEVASANSIETRQGKKRGRPPAVNGKLNKLKETVKKDISTSNEVKCPRCPKTFPNQNSLNTHIQHHNLETSLLNSQQGKSQSNENKHKCNKCESTFKNIFCLNRHTCITKKVFNCSICKQKFDELSKLNAHKKLHMKQNLVKATSNVTISPSKFSPGISKVKSKIYTCKDCSKVFTSLVSLNTHTQTHKKFVCSRCRATFASKILLDAHVRSNCVKSPKNRRLPTNRTSAISKTPSSQKSVVCEICSLKFSTYGLLFQHKVLKHGVQTPDKNLLMKPKKTLFKQKATHGGIPANEKLKLAYASLRVKLENTQL